jgi:hypothetical protein
MFPVVLFCAPLNSNVGRHKYLGFGVSCLKREAVESVPWLAVLRSADSGRAVECEAVTTSARSVAA